MNDEGDYITEVDTLPQLKIKDFRAEIMELEEASIVQKIAQLDISYVSEIAKSI